MKRIPLTQGKFAIVDDEDYDYLNQWRWCAVKRGNTYYAERGTKLNGRCISFKMHRVIMKAPVGFDIDHINHNGLDNRKVNMRICTRSQNLQNQLSVRGRTSKYKGVCYHVRDEKWCSRIRLHRKLIWIGYFTNETEAAKAYDVKALELFGEFACLNFPKESICVS